MVEIGEGLVIRRVAIDSGQATLTRVPAPPHPRAAALAGNTLYIVFQDLTRENPGLVRTLHASRLLRYDLATGAHDLRPLALNMSQASGFVAIDEDRAELLIVGDMAYPGPYVNDECCVPTRIATCALDGSRCTSRTYGATGYEDYPTAFDRKRRQAVTIGDHTTGTFVHIAPLDAKGDVVMKDFAHPPMFHTSLAVPTYFDEARRALSTLGVLARGVAGPTPIGLEYSSRFYRATWKSAAARRSACTWTRRPWPS
jgi:hypothetical protein